MIIKLVLISVFIVAVVMAALGIKMLFDRNARFEAHSCAPEGGSTGESGTCSSCGLKDLAKCAEKNDK